MKTEQNILCWGRPISLEEAAALLVPDSVVKKPLAPPLAEHSSAEVTPLTPIQSQIWAALTARPLNERQIALLEIYWRARAAGEPALAVEEAARRLTAIVGVDSTRAVDFVKGALRSFGRRLLQTLERPPVQIGKDRMGGGVADEIPLLALLAIQAGPSGENRHILTADGAVAVAAALGINSNGMAAGGLMTGDPALDDMDEIVMAAMSRGALALVQRVQRAKGLSFDETLRALASLAGAG
jgi:hypothetical protein